MTLKLRNILPALAVVMLALSACAGPVSSPSSTQPVEATMGVKPTPAAAATDPGSVNPVTPVVETTPVLPATGAETTPLPAGPLSPGTAPAGARFEIVPEKSEARYRVREQLVSLDLPNDAVGVTKGVSGAIVLNADGTVDSSASQFTVDVSTLKSDQDRRDNFVRRNVLQTDQYPTVIFVPREIRGASWPLPESGNFSFQMIGDLTIKDVTREVTWDVAGSLQGGEATGQAKTSFKFGDFSLEQPRVPVVLSIVDNITLELDAVMVMQPTAESAGAVAAGQPPTAPTEPVGSTADAPVCSVPAKLTPPMTEGPYYTENPPERSSLVEPGVVGQKLRLTGYVLDQNCQPIPGAIVDFWQADGQGAYDNSGYRLRGQQKTDASGRYTLETVLPGPYPGRTPHIHVKVQAPGGPLLTSQLFFPGEAQNQTDRIFDSALLVTMKGDQEGRFDFVVEKN